MVFCNIEKWLKYYGHDDVTILILIDGFLQLASHWGVTYLLRVTILILIDGFLQYVKDKMIARNWKKSQSLF